MEWALFFGNRGHHANPHWTGFLRANSKVTLSALEDSNTEKVFALKPIFLVVLGGILHKCPPNVWLAIVHVFGRNALSVVAVHPKEEGCRPSDTIFLIE